MTKITVPEFTERLAVLCLQGGGRGMPRKQRDRQILLKSAMIGLGFVKTYAEVEINDHLARWLTEIGQTVDIDHATLRRLLVDEGYLARDPAGKQYRPAAEPAADLFDPEIDAIDQPAVLEAALARREQAKKAHQGKRDSDDD